MSPILGYWKIKGLVQPTRLLLEYLEEKYEEHLYERDEGDKWRNKKFELGLEFPNLPYYIDGDVKLTQSMAIIRYIADKHNMLGGCPKERAEISMLEGAVLDIRYGVSRIAYSKDFETLKVDFLSKLPEMLKMFEDRLCHKTYLNGDHVTHPDFMLYDALDVVLYMDPMCLDAFPKLVCFKKRIEAIPQIDKYLKSSKYIAWPLQGWQATFGGGDHPPKSDLVPRGSPEFMSLDIQCEQLSDARWTELLPLIQQYEVVRLDDCGLTEVRCKDISSAVQANPALTELSLRTNELGDGGVGLVLQGLQNPTCKIQKLSLQNCGLTEAGCGILPGMLRSLSTLRELHLNDNPMGDAGLKLLCEGLQDPQCRLEKLQLEYCNLTATSCEPLASVLRVKADFKELVLSNNDLHEPGVRILCQGLKDSACQLESLKLENCGITAANCKDLCDVVASKASLQELDLSSNKLGNAGIAALCPGLLLPSCKLRTLWLWECDITAEGCKDLCRVLRAKQSLKELSLASNELKDEGARLLCESLLEPGCQLESLWIKTCSLTAASCPYFCSVLTKSRSLLELQMSSNPLGDEGVQELCKALSQPDTVLRELWLGDCDVTNSGCSSLANVLLANRSLRELDLSNNCMGGPGVLQLLESLKQPSCTLQQLVLYDIYWTNEVEEQLRALEEERPSLRIIS